MRSANMCIQRSCDAKARAIHGIATIEMHPAPGARRGTVPAVTCSNTFFASAIGSSPPITGIAVVLTVPAVLNPFAHIAVHIVESPWIGSEGVYGHSPVATLSFLVWQTSQACKKWTVIGFVEGRCFSPPVRRRRTCARHVFALCLG